MKTVRDIATLREIVGAWRQVGETIALVPTMGNLHQGHMSLVQLAGECAERIVVSVYVNPTQFGPREDFENYPRTFENDRRRLSRAGVDIMFAPDSEEMYPFGQEHMTRVSVPGLSQILCGDDRPQHFDGVTSVVSRLFNIIQPDVAIFGQKDYQQLVIIRRMGADLHMPVRILAGPTFRNKDGLAMSSRNRYLSDDERALAPALHRTISACRDRIVGGDRDFTTLEAEAAAALADAGLEPQYVAIRKAGDLSMPEPDSEFLVVLAAARLGPTRLIDNVLIEPAHSTRMAALR
ncbi:MAG: pantoate--beta-alanine ligase [Gammaproteobacteria bacterium]|nr:pantoate--beta-alanine ligase [Gammaproteobacteria bacterium]NND37559.1 pantoate--beta-alanine ligase [Gammaproteobacteria bacterium]